MQTSLPTDVQEAMRSKGLFMRDILNKTGLSRPTAHSIMCREAIAQKSQFRKAGKAKIEKILGITL